MKACKHCGSDKHYPYQCFHNPNPKQPGNKPCTYCKEEGHTSITCRIKPRRPPRKEAFKTADKRKRTSMLWFTLNPPDKDGYWECYLGISLHCFGIVDEQTITLEHVVPKVKAPELKYDVSNIRPACEPCNKIKASLTVEKLIEIYPHSKLAIDNRKTLA